MTTKLALFALKYKYLFSPVTVVHRIIQNITFYTKYHISMASCEVRCITRSGDSH